MTRAIGQFSFDNDIFTLEKERKKERKEGRRRKDRKIKTDRKKEGKS